MWLMASRVATSDAVATSRGSRSGQRRSRKVLARRLHDRLALRGEQGEELLAAVAGQDGAEQGIVAGPADGHPYGRDPGRVEIPLAAEGHLHTVEELLGQPEDQGSGQALFAGELVVEGLPADPDPVGDVLQPQAPPSTRDEETSRDVEGLVTHEPVGPLGEGTGDHARSLDARAR
jgi:hypothetical protein